MTHTPFLRFLLASACLAAALPALADTRFQIRRMTRNDVPFGKGQCDIRLQVDGEVELSVRGDMVYVRTLSGRDAQDAGSECNEPMPRDPRNFGFDVRDRRGDIRLLSEPMPRNSGAAVVRIRDSAGGWGRYHFRLTWEIGGRGPGSDRFDRLPGGDNRGDRMPPGAGRIPDRGDGIGWSRRLYFTGQGDGLYTHDRFARERIYNVVVRIDPNGTVSVNFERERRGRLNFTGRVTRFIGDNEITAQVIGGDGDILRGSMIIYLTGRDHVRAINMGGRDGRDSFEVRWRD